MVATQLPSKMQVARRVFQSLVVFWKTEFHFKLATGFITINTSWNEKKLSSARRLPFRLKEGG
jgi:hypothetical protein